MLSLSAGCRRNSPTEKVGIAGWILAGDHSVKHNGHFALSLSCLNLIYSRQPNFLATTLGVTMYSIDHIASQATLIWGEGRYSYPNSLRERNVALMMQNVSTVLSKIVDNKKLNPTLPYPRHASFRNYYCHSLTCTIDQMQIWPSNNFLFGQVLNKRKAIE